MYEHLQGGGGYAVALLFKTLRYKLIGRVFDF
jgi:hypothetical protein